jgi:hypothetical protein
VTASQLPLFLPGWDLEPCDGAEQQSRRPDFWALHDKACAEYAAQRQRWADGVRPDAWVADRPAFNVACSIDDWPGGEP